MQMRCEARQERADAAADSERVRWLTIIPCVPLVRWQPRRRPRAALYRCSKARFTSRDRVRACALLYTR
eukprot:scaffold1788_cov396-Prasinococcus_capsulatus_cf.AAC.5